LYAAAMFFPVFYFFLLFFPRLSCHLVLPHRWAADRTRKSAPKKTPPIARTRLSVRAMGGGTQQEHLAQHAVRRCFRRPLLAPPNAMKIPRGRASAHGLHEWLLKNLGSALIPLVLTPAHAGARAWCYERDPSSSPRTFAFGRSPPPLNNGGVRPAARSAPACHP